MSDDFKIPQPPASFSFNPESGDWEGLNSYAEDSTLGGVWSDWTPEEGVTIFFDHARTKVTLAEFETLIKLYSEFAARHKGGAE